MFKVILALIFSPIFAAPQPPVALPPATVSVSKIEAMELFDLFTFPAKVVPKVNTTILSETDGIVVQIVAPLGQKVRRGDKLLRVQHTDPVYQYAPVNVKAPVSGVVSQVEVTEGSQIIRGQKLASVTDPTQVKITVEVPAQDAPSFSQGLTGEFRSESYAQSSSIPCKVVGISPFVDPTTGTVTAELEITRPGEHLAPGILGQALFKMNPRNGITILDSAVFYKGSETYARILEKGRSKIIAIQLGRRQRGRVEVLGGLNAEQLLIERTSRYIGDGEEVTVQ